MPAFKPNEPKKPEKEPKLEPSEKAIIDGVIFKASNVKPDGSREFKSSAPDRKIIILKNPPVNFEASQPHRVRVVEDTNPTDPMEGKMIVEVMLGPEEEKEITVLAQRAQELFAQNDLEGAIAVLEEIQTKANVGVEQLGGFENLREVKEIFGDDFLGIEELAQFRGFEFSKGDQEKAAKLWAKKVQEQNLTREDLEQLKREGFMVILRSPGTKVEGKLVSTTVDNLRKKYPSLFYDQDWYDTEKFATTDQVDFDWSIVKKEILEESRSQNWDEQEGILKEWAKDHKVDPRFVTRRKPVEIIHDILAYYEAHKARILENDYDWSGTESSDGNSVNVGNFDSDGLDVRHDSRDDAHSHLGVCPSR